jgi:tRNA-dihydrouridine synthase B
VSGTSAPTPSLLEQRELVAALYDDLLSHYGLRVGLRHARKHLGWALDVAARASRAPVETLKGWRQRILTTEQPDDVKRKLSDAFDDFAWRAAA